jgi:hypothetical protein
VIQVVVWYLVGVLTAIFVVPAAAYQVAKMSVFGYYRGLSLSRGRGYLRGRGDDNG